MWPVSTHFQTRKSYLMSPPILAYPCNTGHAHILARHASGVEIEAALLQLQDTEEQGILLASKTQK